MPTINLKNIVYKNKLLLDFLDQSASLSSFHNGSSLDMINDDIMRNRDLQVEQRKILVNALATQYDSIGEKAPSGVYKLEKKRSLHCNHWTSVMFYGWSTIFYS